MNPDKWLLAIHQKIADVTNDWIGINCFGLARAAMFLTAVGHVVMFVEDVQKHEAHKYILLYIMNVLLDVLYFSAINSYEHRHRDGFKNIAEDIWKSSRIMFGWFDLFYILVGIHWDNMAMLCLTIAIYFMCCTPKPPKQCWVSKQLERLATT